MAQSQTQTATADDLLAMPRGTGERYELVEGELIVTAAAGGKHGIIIGNFSIELGAYLKQNPLGYLVGSETGFYTRSDDRTVRAPDLAFIHREKISEDGVEAGYFRIAPDLVLEVVSPNDRASEVDAKVQEWLTFGVGEVWVAYPDTKRIMVYRQGAGSSVILNAGDMIDGGSILPGFERTVAIFF